MSQKGHMHQTKKTQLKTHDTRLAHLSQYRVDVRLAALLRGGCGWRFISGILSLNLVLSAFIMTQSDVVHTDRLSLQQTAAQQHQQRNSSHH